MEQAVFGTVGTAELIVAGNGGVKNARPGAGACACEFNIAKRGKSGQLWRLLFSCKKYLKKRRKMRKNGAIMRGLGFLKLSGN